MSSYDLRCSLQTNLHQTPPRPANMIVLRLRQYADTLGDFALSTASS